MHFANAIAIIIAGVFMNAMFDRGMRANDVIVTIRFIGVDDGLGVREPLDMSFQGFTSRVGHHPQTHLTTLTPNRADNGGTVVLIRSASALIIGAAAWRI